MNSLAQILVIACILTVIIEVISAKFLFKINLYDDLVYIALINIFTNISLNLTLYIFNLYFYVLVLEVIVVLLETILYKFYWKDRPVVNLLLFSLILNINSYVFGVLFF